MSDKKDKNRVRSGNWNEEDKLLLKELIKECVKVIENKNTDTNTNNKKSKAWKGVLERYNQITKGCPRTLKQLKTQWSTLKINEKKVIFTEKKYITKTGGGPPPPPGPGHGPDDIAAWCPEEFAVDTNIYDSDFPCQDEMNEPVARPSTPLVIVIEKKGIEAQEESEQVVNEKSVQEESEQVVNEKSVQEESENKENYSQNPRKKKVKQRANNVPDEPGETPDYCKMIAEKEFENQELKRKILETKWEVQKEKLKYYKNKNAKIPDSDPN